MTEKEIIKGCQARNAVYQKALVDKYAPMLLSVCRRYSRKPDEARDVLQESLIRIFNYFDKYSEGKGSLSAWMRMICMNTALKYFDKNCFKKQIQGLNGIEETTVGPVVLSNLHAEDLMNIVENLPDGYRQVFNLYAIEGYSHKEIAKMLGIGESASRSNLSRARSLLKVELAKRQMPVTKAS